MQFIKMHGLGNDFVIVDARKNNQFDFAKMASRLGDRRRGVGFDQLAIIHESSNCDARLMFFNQDGSPSATCGNATRCVGRMLIEECNKPSILLETGCGVLTCEDAGNGNTSVNMGHPDFTWQNIPLATEMDTNKLPINGEPFALSLGNPHCVFFVPDAESVDLKSVGPVIEKNPIFPNRTNVEFATVKSNHSIRMRIWERGAGITLASGSGACATAIAANRRGMVGTTASVITDGGTLQIELRDTGVWKTGSTNLVFQGQLSAEWYAYYES